MTGNRNTLYDQGPDALEARSALSPPHCPIPYVPQDPLYIQLVQPQEAVLTALPATPPTRLAPPRAGLDRRVREQVNLSARGPKRAHRDGALHAAGSLVRVRVGPFVLVVVVVAPVEERLARASLDDRTARRAREGGTTFERVERV